MADGRARMRKPLRASRGGTRGGAVTTARTVEGARVAPRGPRMSRRDRFAALPRSLDQAGPPGSSHSQLRFVRVGFSWRPGHPGSGRRGRSRRFGTKAFQPSRGVRGSLPHDLSHSKRRAGTRRSDLRRPRSHPARGNRASQAGSRGDPKSAGPESTGSRSGRPPGSGRNLRRHAKDLRETKEAAVARRLRPVPARPSGARTRRLRKASGHAALMVFLPGSWISIGTLRAVSIPVAGRTTSRTPFWNVALICSFFTPSGSWKVLSKRPRAISRK